MIGSINKILVFILEMVMLFSYGYFGMTMQWSLPLKILFTILIVSIAILLWSIFAAPKSGRRLKIPYLAFFRAMMFALSAWLLFRSGYKSFAIIVFALALITQAISYCTEQ